MIKTDADLLRMLLRRHYELQSVPQLFVERLIMVLNQDTRFRSWPLAELLTERSVFFTFLQQRWPSFLSRLTEAALPERTSPSVSGPMDLPFDILTTYLWKACCGLLNGLPCQRDGRGPACGRVRSSIGRGDSLHFPTLWSERCRGRVRGTGTGSPSPAPGRNLECSRPRLDLDRTPIGQSGSPTSEPLWTPGLADGCSNASEAFTACLRHLLCGASYRPLSRRPSRGRRQGRFGGD